MVIVGRVKIPYNDLFYLNQMELNALIEGHELDKRDDWERTRLATYIGVSPNFKKGSKLKPQDIFPLPWDAKDDYEGKVERAKQKLELLKNGKVRN